MDYDTWLMTWDLFPLPRRLQYPRNETFSDFPNDDLWAEHWDRHSTIIPNLYRPAVDEIKIHLLNGKISDEDAELIAEHLPCEYIKTIIFYKNEPRLNKQKNEFETLKATAIKFQKALMNLSTASISFLNLILDESLESDSGAELLGTAELFFSIKDNNEACIHVNPKTIFSISDIAVAAKHCASKTPKDPKGLSSGKFDSTGRMTRDSLAMSIRVLLRHLDLNYGSQKCGPVSKLLGLIHQAAIEQSPEWMYYLDKESQETERMKKDLTWAHEKFNNESDWADRYAAKSPALEKLWLEYDALFSARENKPINNETDFLDQDQLCDSLRYRYKIRREQYLLEMKRFNA